MRYRILVVVVTALLATALAGCDRSGHVAAGDADKGKRVFRHGCAVCHTLADAGATGVEGPNLDRLRPTRTTVANQVRDGGGGMPSFRDTLSKDDIVDVATYVEQAAGREQG